jgi:hypothetical protein
LRRSERLRLLKEALRLLLLEAQRLRVVGSAPMQAQQPRQT